MRLAGDHLSDEELLRALDLQELMPRMRDGIRDGMNLERLMLLLNHVEQQQHPMVVNEQALVNWLAQGLS
jgi:hypothetical protein